MPVSGIKALLIVALAQLLGVVGLGLAASGPAAGAAAKSFVLPVLVQVDKDGHVVTVDPALQLPDALLRLLRGTVSQLIGGSAHACHSKGTCTGGTVVMELELKIDSAPHGSYRASFQYHSVDAVPVGTWHWCLKRAPNRTSRHPFTAYLTPGGEPARCPLHPRGRAYAFGHWDIVDSWPLLDP